MGGKTMIVQLNTKQILVDSFKELLTKQSFHSIKVEDITKNCNMSRTTFYKHFKDKYHLMEWEYRNVVENMHGGNGQTYDSNYRLLNYIYKNKEYYAQVIKYKGQNSFVEYLHSYIFEYCVEEAKNKELVLTDELIFSIKMYTGGCVYALTRWIEEGYKASPEAFAYHVELNMSPQIKNILQNDIL